MQDLPIDLVISWLLSAGTPYMLEYLKGKPWFPLVQPYAPILNRVTAIAVSALTALGVTWSYDAAAGELVIRGLVLADLVRLAISMAGNLLVQEVVYRQRINVRRPR